MKSATYCGAALGLLVILLAAPEARQAPATARTPVDVSKLGIHDAIHISDVTAPSGATRPPSGRSTAVTEPMVEPDFAAR